MTKPSAIVANLAEATEEVFLEDMKVNYSGRGAPMSLSERLDARVRQLHLCVERRSGVARACAEVGSVLAQLAHVGDEAAPSPQTELPLSAADMQSLDVEEEEDVKRESKGSPRAKK